MTGPRMDSELCRQRGDTNVRSITAIAGQLVCLKAKIKQTLSKQKRIGHSTDRRVQKSLAGGTECQVLPLGVWVHTLFFASGYAASYSFLAFFFKSFSCTSAFLQTRI